MDSSSAPDTAETRLWAVLTGDADAGMVDAARAMLSEAERARCEALRRPSDRRDYAIAHALLRRALMTASHEPLDQWRFATNASGKPSLEPLGEGGSLPPRFNLSHTDGLVACVVSYGCDVGVDVERTDRTTDVDLIASRAFAPVERRMLVASAGSDRAERFAELWTLKEAYVKAIGAGLSRGFSDFAFEFVSAGGLIFNPPEGVCAADWSFALFAPAVGYRLAVALRRLTGAAAPRLRCEAAPEAGGLRLLRSSRHP